MFVLNRFRRLGRSGLLLVIGLALTGPTASAQKGFPDVMAFASDMAKQGNWREARFRWELALEQYPDHWKILNNLAVASEAVGDLDSARAYYRRAVEVGGRDETIETNVNMAKRFWRQVGDDLVREPEVAAEATARPPKKLKGKTMKVTVRLPVPPRLDVSEVESMLVASFLSDESSMLDINRELVRFLRSELRKNVEFEILPITPAPAVPEQTLDDLIANDKFWKHLGREYDVDLIVSGEVIFSRKDASGFYDVDTVSASTGQKVRSSEFIEQERFTYALDIIFMDGATGELRFRDRLQRSAVFRGTQNDPVTAFYDLNDALVPDVLGIVRSRRKEDVRLIFKR